MEETPIAVFKTYTRLFRWPAELRLYKHEVEAVNVSMGLTTSRESRQRTRYDQIAQVGINKRWTEYWEVIIESTGGHTMRIYPLVEDIAQEARAAIEERMKPARSPTTTAPSGAPSIPTQIRELAELRDAGIITEAEFAEKKKDLLDRM